MRKRDYVKEIILFLKYSILGTFVKEPPSTWQNGTLGDVIIIEGHFENFHFLAAIADRLNKKGYKIHVPRYNHTQTIVEISEDIVKYIQEQKLDNIVLLARCKGGLTAKYILDNHNKIREKIAGIITIATPYRGLNFMATNFSTLKELKSDSTFLETLNAATKYNYRILNLMPAYDTFVSPKENMLLEKGRNIQINVSGHTLISDKEDSYVVIKEYLESIFKKGSNSPMAIENYSI